MSGHEPGTPVVSGDGPAPVIELERAGGIFHVTLEREAELTINYGDYTHTDRGQHHDYGPPGHDFHSPGGDQASHDTAAVGEDNTNSHTAEDTSSIPLVAAIISSSDGSAGSWSTEPKPH